MMYRTLTLFIVAIAATLAHGDGTPPRLASIARPALGVGMDPAPVTPDSPAQQMLDRRIDSIEFEAGQKLSSAIRAIADVSKANIYIDWLSLAEADIKPDVTLVTGISLRNVSVRSALKAVASCIESTVELGFGPDDDMIVVATHAARNKAVCVVVYNVRDILDAAKPKASGDPGRQETLDTLWAAIHSVVSEDSWGEDNSRGNIHDIAGLLIISQSPENQQTIAGLLAAIRESSRTAPPAGVLADPQLRKLYEGQHPATRQAQ